MPKLIYWHRGMFLPRQPLTSGLLTASSVDYKDRDSSLLEFISSVSNRLYEQIKTNIDNLSITYTDHDWTLNLNHDFTIVRRKISIFAKRNDERDNTKVKFTMSEPIKQYLSEASPVASGIITIALEQKQLIDHVDRMIMETKYIGKRMGSNQISSLIDFIDKGITNMQQSVEKTGPLQACLSEGFIVLMKALRGVRHDEKLVNESYLEVFQSLVKNWLCSIPFGDSSEIKYTSVLPQIVSFFMQYGGFEVSSIIAAFPRVFPSAMKDQLLCECICEIHDKLNDQFETRAVVPPPEEDTQYDFDRFKSLTSELKNCLMLLEDPFSKCHMALKSVLYLEYNEALDMLEVCVEDCSRSTELVTRLREESQKIQWFEQVRT